MIKWGNKKMNEKLNKGEQEGKQEDNKKVSGTCTRPKYLNIKG